VPKYAQARTREELARVMQKLADEDWREQEGQNWRNQQLDDLQREVRNLRAERANDYRITADALVRILKRQEAQERELKSLKDKQTIWRGIYSAGQKYPRNSLVTRSGSLWVSTEDTASAPGNENSCWTLVVKNGAVAK
jgi:hypothetical protein